MSEKLPRVTAADAIRVLEQAGFSFRRQTGSHKKVSKKMPATVDSNYQASKEPRASARGILRNV
jgi:predicted RNA binding protein YcfA (HicA-like mRNA interferase family)